MGVLTSKRMNPVNPNFLFSPRFCKLIILALVAIALIVLVPSGEVFADSNAPTVTNTPEPTNTPTPVPPTQEVPPTETAVPLATQEPDNIMGATAIPLPTPELSSGLSTINRILLVILAIATVLIIGVIVYLVYYQTRGGGLSDR